MSDEPHDTKYVCFHCGENMRANGVLAWCPNKGCIAGRNKPVVERGYAELRVALYRSGHETQITIDAERVIEVWCESAERTQDIVDLAIYRLRAKMVDVLEKLKP